jgi:poly(3-hydroxybutyrate) depolymerase
VVVHTDVALGGYPQAMDVYVPSNATRAIVFLHGGGGTKEMGAYRESGIRTDFPLQAVPVPDTAWLLATGSAWIFPQGQHIAGSPLAKTWNNYSMTSGVDDVAFLGALANALRGGTLVTGLPALSRVYLAGHSNGGMMAARQWCEASTTFDAYGSLSGPPSVELLSSGAHPCSPTTGRPYLAVVGGADTVVQTSLVTDAGIQDNWDGAWAVNACLQAGAGAAMPNPNLANEEPFHRQVRVAAVCHAAAGAPLSSATATTWSDCDGQVKLVRVTGADHCVTQTGIDACVGGTGGGGCHNALDTQYGQRMRDTLTEFFVSTE